MNKPEIVPFGLNRVLNALHDNTLTTATIFKNTRWSLPLRDTGGNIVNYNYIAADPSSQNVVALVSRVPIAGQPGQFEPIVQWDATNQRFIARLQVQTAMVAGVSGKYMSAKFRNYINDIKNNLPPTTTYAEYIMALELDAVMKNNPDHSKYDYRVSSDPIVNLATLRQIYTNAFSSPQTLTIPIFYFLAPSQQSYLSTAIIFLRTYFT